MSKKSTLTAHDRIIRGNPRGACPQMKTSYLATTYLDMAADVEREKEATEWVEALIADVITAEEP